VKHLDIQSSPRGESSDSITLTTSFVEACKSASASIVVDSRQICLPSPISPVFCACQLLFLGSSTQRSKLTPIQLPLPVSEGS